jgi:hypothetical protein
MFKPLTIFLLAGASSLSAANFFPLQKGNSWTYQMAGTPLQLIVKVGVPIALDGRDWYPLSGYAKHPVLVRYEGDRLISRDASDPQETQLTSFLPGDRWLAPLRECRQIGEAQGTRAKYDDTSGALEIRYETLDCADAGTLSELFVENLGMVRRTVQTFAGPRGYELISAHLVSPSAEPSPSGRFSVSFDRAAANELTVMLRVDLNSGSTLPLTFASGQEFDIAVRDETGREVYRWSAGRSFIQAQHSITVEGEWAASVSIPRPEPGTYSLQAWLTTATPVPQYAATVPLVI